MSSIPDQNAAQQAHLASVRSLQQNNSASGGHHPESSLLAQAGEGSIKGLNSGLSSSGGAGMAGSIGGGNMLQALGDANLDTRFSHGGISPIDLGGGGAFNGSPLDFFEGNMAHINSLNAIGSELHANNIGYGNINAGEAFGVAGPNLNLPASFNATGLGNKGGGPSAGH